MMRKKHGNKTVLIYGMNGESDENWAMMVIFLERILLVIAE